MGFRVSSEQLRRLNTKLIASDPENTAMLERQLLEVDETVEKEGPPPLGPVHEEPPSLGSSVVNVSQKRLLDEIVVQPLPTKWVCRVRSTRKWPQG